MANLQTLQSLGISLPSPAYILGDYSASSGSWRIVTESAPVASEANGSVSP